MINEQGGINGRKVNLISVDDGYSPPKRSSMISEARRAGRSLFVFQSLGTPSNPRSTST